MSGFVAEHRRRSNAKLITRINVIKGDITKQSDVDAIVSSIGSDLEVNGSLNESIIKAAGSDLDNFLLENIYKPRPTDTYVVPGFNLPTGNVIYVVTPPKRDEFDRADVHLLRCYRLSMKIAQQMKLKKIAFPALGTGNNGYPLARATRLAIKGIMERITPSFEEVRIVCNRDETFDSFLERLKKYGTLETQSE